MRCSEPTSFCKRRSPRLDHVLSIAATPLAQTCTFDSFGRQIDSFVSATNPFQHRGRKLDPRELLETVDITEKILGPCPFLARSGRRTASVNEEQNIFLNHRVRRFDRAFSSHSVEVVEEAYLSFRDSKHGIVPRS